MEQNVIIQAYEQVVTRGKKLVIACSCRILIERYGFFLVQTEMVFQSLIDLAWSL